MFIKRDFRKTELSGVFTFVVYSVLLTSQIENRGSMSPCRVKYILCYKKVCYKKVRNLLFLIVSYLETICSTSRNKGDDYVL